MSRAYACRLSERNFGAIASEKPGFDMEDTIAWLNEHGEGYFVRDEDSPWDCNYLSDVVFHEIYAFEYDDKEAIFRPIRRMD